MGAFFMLTAAFGKSGQRSTSSHCHTRSMARVRVYELAREFGVESKVVMATLREMGHRVRSASWIVEPLILRKLEDALSVATPAQMAPPLPAPPRAAAQEDFYYDPWLDGPEEVTAAEAASLCQVRTATIRQWVSRGYLTRVGIRGRAPLYDVTALRRVRSEVARRTPKPPPPRPNVASKHLDALVSGPDAAKVVGVAPSTIRMWVKRGRLTPAISGPRPQFKLADVLSTARRRR